MCESTLGSLFFIILHGILLGIIMPKARMPMTLSIICILAGPFLPERIGIAIFMSGSIVFVLGVLYGIMHLVKKFMRKYL